MNRYVILSALALLAAAPVAQATPPTPPDFSNAIGFEAQKAQMLKSIGDRMADLQKKQLCVEAAVKPEDMKVCFKPSTGMIAPPSGAAPAAENKAP